MLGGTLTEEIIGMSRRKEEHVTASEAEKTIFLDVIDARASEFLDAVSSCDVDSDVLDELRQWTEETRCELRHAFSAWYEENVEGTSIPKELIVPAPRQDRIYRKFAKTFADSACEVCGDTRVLNIAHIIPRHDDGPDEEWNLMRLCADHHYLFDSALLTEEEWNCIDWNSKDTRARAYAMECRLVAHELGWRRTR